MSIVNESEDDSINEKQITVVTPNMQDSHSDDQNDKQDIVAKVLFNYLILDYGISGCTEAYLRHDNDLHLRDA